MTARVAIIQFPGSNCEYETKTAAQQAGLEACIVRWNEDPSELAAYDGYILPGGFSYQDRVRAGAIAAKLPVVSVLEAADRVGKPVLGICNGCQILAEIGLIPNLAGEHHLRVALAPNSKDGLPHGFVCDWVYVKVKHPKRSAFTLTFSENDVLPIAINHGEGRFVLDSNTQTALDSLTTMTYCALTGDESATYPINPNGTFANLAGISTPKGNVLAMMPHPERGTFIKQIPDWLSGVWADKKHKAFKTNTPEPGPWAPLFTSMKRYIDNGYSLS